MKKPRAASQNRTGAKSIILDEHSHPSPGRKPSRDEIVAKTVDWLRVLIAPDQVTELRALHVQRGRERPHTESGFFDHDHLDEMAKLAVEVSPSAKGVYFTLNPLRPDILAQPPRTASTMRRRTGGQGRRRDRAALVAG